MTETVSNKEQFFVAVKVFLENKDGKLLILKDKWNCWDIPGGRMKPHEFETSLEDIVKRKMSEELGESVTYKLGKPEVFMRHERVEDAPGNPTVRIFALGYTAKLTGGEVRLSDHHVKMEWVSKDFKADDYFTGGWLKGVEDYQLLQKN